MKRRNRQNSYERGGQLDLAKAMGNVAKKGEREINEGRDTIKGVRRDIENANKDITNYKRGIDEQKAIIQKKEGYIKDLKKDLGGIYNTVQDAKKQKAKFAKGGTIEERVYAIVSKRTNRFKEGFFTYNQFKRYADELSNGAFMDEAESQGLVWSSMDKFLDSNEYNEEGDNLIFREIPVKMMVAEEYINPMLKEKLARRERKYYTYDIGGDNKVHIYQQDKEDENSFDSIEQIITQLKKEGHKEKDFVVLKKDGKFAKGGLVIEGVRFGKESEDLEDYLDNNSWEVIEKDNGDKGTKFTLSMKDVEYEQRVDLEDYLDNNNLKYIDNYAKGGKIVWVGDMPLDIDGREELTEEEAERLAKEWKEKGYDDVIIEDYAKGGSVSTIKTEYIKFLKDNDVDVEKLKFRHIKSGPYGDEVWTYPKRGGEGFVITRDTFESIKKDDPKDFIYGYQLPTTYAKGGKIEITSAPEYHKVRNKEYDKRVSEGKIKDTDENFEKFDDEYFNELVKKGKIDMDNYFAKGGEIDKYYSKMMEKLGKDGAFERVLKDSQFGIPKGQTDFQHNRLNKSAYVIDGKAFVFDNKPKGDGSLKYSNQKEFTSPKELAEYLDKNEIFAKGGKIEDMSYEELMDVVFEENSSNQNEKLAKEIAKIQGFKYDAVEYADFHLVVRDYLDKSTNKNDDESREVLLQAFENTGIEYDDDDEYAKGGYVWVEKDNIMDVEDFEEDGEVEFGSYKDMMESLDEWNEQLDTNYSTIKEFNDGEEYRRIMTIKEFEEYKKDWLKDEGYAKGGEVKKKGNEMLIGGLAGILLGIFLNK